MTTLLPKYTAQVKYIILKANVFILYFSRAPAFIAAGDVYMGAGVRAFKYTGYQHIGSIKGCVTNGAFSL